MNSGYTEFLRLEPDEGAAVFDATAQRLGTRASNVEKDFWVCLTLDALFNGRPADAHRVVFKGGTSLSKIYDAISRFSEDVDIVVMREDLGFEGAHDPASGESALRGKPLARAIEHLRKECRAYVRVGMRDELAAAMATLPEPPEVAPDPEAGDEPVLLVRYRSITDTGDGYNAPAVRIEAGARSAVLPDVTASVRPYIAEDVGMDLGVANVRAVAAERTFLEKLVILHGIACRHRDQGHVLADRNRLSRHYYDVARLSEMADVANAARDHALLADVVEHSRRTFGNGWRRLEEAAPGTMNVAPPDAVAAQLARTTHGWRT